MHRRLTTAGVATCALLAAAFGTASTASASPAARQGSRAPARLSTPSSIQAPDSALAPKAEGDACTTPEPTVSYQWIHCYTPGQIRRAYGVDQLPYQGEGQTIVLVDSYGTPTGAKDLRYFHDTFFENLPAPNFDEVYPHGKLTYHNRCHGNGKSGPAAAAAWAGEATLDIEWAYAIAPKAHIVLLAVPPAETLGVQGFPNLFKAVSQAIDRYPAGTTFSFSLGVSEETFGGAAKTQTSRFDRVFKKGLAKGDTFFVSSGDSGTMGLTKRHRDTVPADHKVADWPTSSPYVTSVGGTQLMEGWTWRPTSDTPFLSDGSYNPAYFAYTGSGDTEPVWNESWLPAATGGGLSEIYPRPSWQDSVKNIVGDHRGYPDLAWNASVNGGVLVYTSFFPPTRYGNGKVCGSRVGWHIYGGTSAASPQVAALTALANQARREAGEGPVGYLNPLLYTDPALGASATPGFTGAGAFRDVVSHTYGTAASGVLDDNRMWAYQADGSVAQVDIPGYPVRAGYDLTTGYGTPRAPGFVTALVAAGR